MYRIKYLSVLDALFSKTYTELINFHRAQEGTPEHDKCLASFKALWAVIEEAGLEDAYEEWKEDAI